MAKVSLDSFKIQDGLNGLVWDKSTGLMDSRVRLRLMSIADEFLEWCGLSGMERDVMVLGSICGYNWSDFSDIDLHIIVDYSDFGIEKEALKKMFNALKNNWNNDHGNLSVKGFPVEMYIQGSDEGNASESSYSLWKNEWIDKPKRFDETGIELNKWAIKCKAKEIMSIVDGMESRLEQSEGDHHAIEKICADSERLSDKVSKMRKDGLSSDGEYSNGNITYKVLRRMGYIDRMRKLKNRAFDWKNSESSADI